MQVMILAAGQGTRLRPLTDEMPKCLVKLLGKSLLQRQVDILNTHGVGDLTVICGYRADKLLEEGYRVVLNKDYLNTNMVATLFSAQRYISDEKDLIISYGDIIYESKVIEALSLSNAPISVVVDRKWRDCWEMRFENPLVDAETLKIDEKGFIKEIGKKPSSYDDIQAQYIGLVKVRSDYVEKIKTIYKNMDRMINYDGKDFANMYMTSFIQHFIDIGIEVKAVQIDNGWLEVDSISDLKAYEKLYDCGKLSDFISI